MSDIAEAFSMALYRELVRQRLGIRDPALLKRLAG